MGISLIFRALFIISIFTVSLTHAVSQAYAKVPYARPAEVLPPDIVEKLDRRINLDLRNIDVVNVIKFLSEKADLNIVTSQNVNAKVTLFLKDVSIGSAFEIILISSGLAFREKNNIIYVMTEEEYSALYGETYRDQRQIRFVQLKYTDATKVGEILGSVKSSLGKIIIDEATGTLVLIDTSEKVEMMERMAKKMDIPTVTRTFPTTTQVWELAYNTATDLEAQVTALLTPGVGEINVNERSNRIMVTDLPYALQKIGDLIEAFDLKTRQVYIETRMFQVRLSNDYDMGIDWRGIFNEGQGSDKFPWDFTGTFPASSTLSQMGELAIGDLGRWDFNATIDMLHTFGDTKTLASPQLTVENGEEATILVGTREAYVTSTVSQADSTTTTSESITFIDVGVQLRVLPTINKDGFVSIRIAPEISSVGRNLTTSNGNEIPIVDTTTASTKVMIKDGHTVLIGGLMQDELVKTVRKFPILGDIPILGTFFRSIDEDNENTELVIFLTPHIIEGDEPRPFTPTAAGKPFEPLRDFDTL